jgi:hypothetical protein
METPEDIQSLSQQLLATDRDAQQVAAGLSEDLGTRRPSEEGWSVAHCLDHLGTANRVYLESMLEPARGARAAGRHRRGPAKPGLVGRLFVSTLEPPPRWWSRLRAPGKIRPRPAPSLESALAGFLATQAEVRGFLVANADLDLSAIPFPNPFIRGIAFSLATGLNVIAAHDRRHLFQAWRIRRALEDQGR